MASFAYRGLVVFALSIACAASAAESVSLQSESASGTLDQLKCWGGVTVRLGDWVVTGDEAVCDLASRTIRVTGNVEIQTPDGAFTGEEAAFTEADETFTLDKGGFEATVGSSGSPVYFVAERITFVRSSAQLDGTTVTTCDRLDLTGTYVPRRSNGFRPTESCCTAPHCGSSACLCSTGCA